MNENSKDLPWVEKIEASGSRNFTLPLHVEYQNEQYARVKAFDQGRLRTAPAGAGNLPRYPPHRGECT